MQVGELMTWNPACCAPDSTLQKVAQMMEENDCGCIPVVSSLESMEPIGTITDRDITIRSVASGGNPMNMKAADIMTTGIATVKPQMSVEDCFRVMEDRNIRRVLVVDAQGRCCGIVAQADLVQSAADSIRATSVIREISISAPSPQERVSMSREETGGSLQSKMGGIGGGIVFPLLIGLGSGAVLMYLLSARRNASGRRSIGHINYSHENRMDLGDHENFGRYVDAEQEIEKRQQDLEDRVQTLRTGQNSPTSDSLNHEQGQNNKGRSAGQGS